MPLPPSVSDYRAVCDQTQPLWESHLHHTPSGPVTQSHHPHATPNCPFHKVFSSCPAPPASSSLTVHCSFPTHPSISICVHQTDRAEQSSFSSLMDDEEEYEEGELIEVDMSEIDESLQVSACRGVISSITTLILRCNPSKV